MPSSIPQPAHSTRQLALTFTSTGSGMVADVNHQPAQAAASAMVAFIGTNTETFILCIVLYSYLPFCVAYF